MCDIHNFSNIRIENIEHSYSDFVFKRQKNEYHPEVFLTYKWSNFWTQLSNSLGVFHADLWAEDMELCHGKNYEEFTKGALSDWATDNGAKATYYLTKVYPDAVITLRDFLMMDFENYDMMARAGYRLAVLLNEVVK